MDKIIRNAVRCFILNKNDEVVCIKHLKGKGIGFYDFPGGKIESGETPIEAAKRECIEETGIEILNPKYRGTIKVNYPDIVFVFKTFLVTEYIGIPQNFDANTSERTNINEILTKKVFANSIILEKHLRSCLLNENKEFKLDITVDDDENILKLDFKYI